MIADDLQDNSEVFIGKHSLPQNVILDKIILSIKKTFEGFLKINNDFAKLNEDDITQIFVQQNFVQLQILGLTSLYVSVQYRDLQHDTKSIPDIYYSFTEQGIYNTPEFIMEAKRLPTPSREREKEYVFGKTNAGNPNGGIERFKIGKHGKELNECGILGYVEKEDFKHWLTKINSWIKELSLLENSIWNVDECLEYVADDAISNYCLSNVNRASDKLKLHHFWVKITT